MLISPTPLRSTPQQQRVGNGQPNLASSLQELCRYGNFVTNGMTDHEAFLRGILEAACSDSSKVNYLDNTGNNLDWPRFLHTALTRAIESRNFDLDSLHPSILELDEQLAGKYGVEGVTSVLQHILNNPPPASSLDSFNKSPHTI